MHKAFLSTDILSDKVPENLAYYGGKQVQPSLKEVKKILSNALHSHKGCVSIKHIIKLSD